MEIDAFVEDELRSDEIQKGQVRYSLIVFKEDSRNPVLIRAQDPLTLPGEGESFEIRSDGRTLKGIVDEKRMVMSHSPNHLNIVVTIALK